MSLYATAVKKPVTTALVFVAVVIMGLFFYQSTCSRRLKPT